jgi:splicing factor 1
MICRVCGNSGHMGRDCPERQQGGDWRGGDGPPRRPPAIRNPDNDFNSLMSGRQDGPPQRIEAGPGGYAPPPPADDGLKPWERGPPSAGGAPGGWAPPGRQDSNGGAAPWASGGGRGGGGNNNNYGYQPQSSYGMPPAPPVGGGQPWAGQSSRAPPAAPGYGYPPQADYGYQAPQNPWAQNGGYNAVPPPPPAGSVPPPPPPSSAPPPPPPSNQPPPPPPRY